MKAKWVAVQVEFLAESDLWQTVVMAKHKFAVGVNEGGLTVGAQCIRCGVIAMYENGQVPEDIREQECKRMMPAKPLRGS